MNHNILQLKLEKKLMLNKEFKVLKHIFSCLSQLCLQCLQAFNTITQTTEASLRVTT